MLNSNAPHVTDGCDSRSSVMKFIFINHERRQDWKHTPVHTNTFFYQWSYEWNFANMIPFQKHLSTQPSNQLLSYSVFFSFPDFSMKCSAIILPQFSMQPIIIAALAHLFCQSERNGEGQLTPNTHPSSALSTPSQTHTDTNNHSNKHSHRWLKANRQQWRTKTHMQKGNSPGWGWAMVLGLGLARVERGTISCPSASEKSTLGTRANIFPPR